jgi:hypothetical protein
MPPARLVGRYAVPPVLLRLLLDVEAILFSESIV